MYMYTSMSLLDVPTLYDKRLELTQKLVQELLHFSCFRFWPPGGLVKNQIGPKFGVRVSWPRGTYV
jgi:hypothetical protein